MPNSFAKLAYLIVPDKVYNLFGLLIHKANVQSKPEKKFCYIQMFSFCLASLQSRIRQFFIYV